MPKLICTAKPFKVIRSRKRWAVARRLLIPPEPCSIKREFNSEVVSFSPNLVPKPQTYFN